MKSHVINPSLMKVLIIWFFKFLLERCKFKIITFLEAVICGTVRMCYVVLLFKKKKKKKGRPFGISN